MTGPAIVHLALMWRCSLIMRNVIVCDSFATSFVVDRFVVVVIFWIARNDVPVLSVSDRVGGQLALTKLTTHEADPASIRDSKERC